MLKSGNNILLAMRFIILLSKLLENLIIYIYIKLSWSPVSQSIDKLKGNLTHNYHIIYKFLT